MKNTAELKKILGPEAEFEAEIQKIVSMSIAEVHAELRRFGQSPTKQLPKELKQLITRSAKSSRRDALTRVASLRYLVSKLVQPTWDPNPVRVVVVCILVGLFTILPPISRIPSNKWEEGEIKVAIRGFASQPKSAETIVKLTAPTKSSLVNDSQSRQLPLNNRRFVDVRITAPKVAEQVQASSSGKIGGTVHGSRDRVFDFKFDPNGNESTLTKREEQDWQRKRGTTADRGLDTVDPNGGRVERLAREPGEAQHEKARAEAGSVRVGADREDRGNNQERSISRAGFSAGGERGDERFSKEVRAAEKALEREEREQKEQERKGRRP